MTDKKREVCEFCKYWEGDDPVIDEVVEEGYCHRYPPFLGFEGEELDSRDYHYPVTRRWDYCGEFKKESSYLTLEALDLKPSTERILRKQGIDSVEKLLGCTPKYIKSLRGIGLCAYREMQESLTRFDLYINGTDEEVQMILREVAEAEAAADATVSAAVKEALGID